jgi:antitoxin component of MazEF toxin-antitoxin module
VKVEVKKIDSSSGIMLPEELMTRLRLEQGGSLYVTEQPEGATKFMVSDPEFAEAIEIAERGMKKYAWTAFAVSGMKACRGRRPRVKSGHASRFFPASPFETHCRCRLDGLNAVQTGFRAFCLKEDPMAEHHETAMDYAEHERTYALFLSLTKWIGGSVIVLLILMAYFLL